MAKQTITFSRKRSESQRRTRQADRLVRVLKLIERLQGRGSWTVQTLAAELECSEREVYRYLDVLRLAGIPLTFDRHAQRYCLLSDFRFPALDLTRDELLGQAAATAVSRVPELQLGPGAAATTHKLAAGDKERARLLALAGDVIAVLGLKLVDHCAHAETLRTIQQALVAGKQLKGTYRSPYSTKAWTATLHPYRLCLAGQAWYLIGRRETCNGVLTLRVARFKSLRLLDGPAEVPTDFDLAAYFGDAWSVYPGQTTYDVELSFSREAAVQVCETRWHATQRVQRHRDGGATLTFRVAGLDEIIWWLLGWAGFVEVVRPIELRRMFVEQLQDALRMNRLDRDP
ncbi:MAG TPA: transcriptional regulator [Pirellulales bacterium]|nr:transcriptional regulator [Pirellulales bacterium]